MSVVVVKVILVAVIIIVITSPLLFPLASLINNEPLLIVVFLIETTHCIYIPPPIDGDASSPFLIEPTPHGAQSTVLSITYCSLHGCSTSDAYAPRS